MAKRRHSSRDLSMYERHLVDVCDAVCGHFKEKAIALVESGKRGKAVRYSDLYWKCRTECHFDRLGKRYRKMSDRGAHRSALLRGVC